MSVTEELEGQLAEVEIESNGDGLSIERGHLLALSLL